MKPACTDHETFIVLREEHFSLMQEIENIGVDVYCLREAKMFLDIKAAFPDALTVLEPMSEYRPKGEPGPVFEDGDRRAIFGVALTKQGHELIEQHLTSVTSGVS